MDLLVEHQPCGRVGTIRWRYRDAQLASSHVLAT
jgi:hypothetical protein